MTDFGFGSPTIKAFIYRKQNTGINLGNYITSVNIHKDMTQSAGTFEYHLAYAPDNKPGATFPSIQEVLDGIAPNDYMEMQIQDQPGHPAYFMNGFVDDISFSESGGSGNDIKREVVISGRDYGSLLMNYYITYLTNAKDLAQYLSIEALAYTFGQANTQGNTDAFPYNISASKLVNNIVNIILNDHHIKGLQQFYNPNIQKIFSHVYVPEYLGADSLGLQSYTGSLDDLIRQLQSPPWGEYFVRDEEDHRDAQHHFSSPHLYYRIAPYITGDKPGTFVGDGSRAPGTLAWYNDIQYGHVNLIEISRKDVMSVDLTRSQSEVYTYFLTVPTGQSFQELGNAVVATGLNLGKGLGNPYYDGNAGQTGVERARRFGFRQLEGQTPWVLGDPTKKSFVVEIAGVTAQFWDLCRRLNEWLVNTMGHNEELYSGQLTNRGIHGVRIGDYIKYKDLYCYVQSIEIDWAEGEPITEHLQVIRGQKFNKIPFPLRAV